MNKQERNGATIVYTRVSTREQADSGLSLAAQERACIAYCRARELEIVRSCQDVCSGSMPLATRVGGGELVSLTRRGGYGHVVLVRLDRGFRSVIDASARVGEWAHLGVAVHFLDLDVDTSTPTGLFFVQVLAAFAELERKLIGARTKSALEARRRQGFVSCAPPFGWDADEIGQAVPNETEQATIGWILRLTLEEAKSRSQVAEILTKAGRPTKRGGKWTHRQVGRILSRLSPDDPWSNKRRMIALEAWEREVWERER